MSAGTVGKRVRIRETLGKGSYGTVYLGDYSTEQGLQRRVAIKVLNEREGAVEHEARHRDEARLLALLNHESIVKVYELLRFQGRPAFMLEYVEGANAEHLVARVGPLPPRAALAIGVAVAGALEAAYNAPSPATQRPLHVIHRDIKPGNILISVSGGVKVLDFGIAKADFDRDAQTQDQLLGTGPYMAPECFRSTTVGPEVDVYALGMTLVRLLSGMQPERLVAREDSFDVQRSTLLARTRAGLPSGVWGDELCALLRRMLAWEPEDRPLGAALQDLLMELQDGAPGERLPPFARRTVPPLVEELKRRVRSSTESIPTELTLSDGGEVHPVSTPPTSKPLRAGWGLALGGLAGAAGLALLALTTAGIYLLAQDEPSMPVGQAAQPATPSALTVVNGTIKKRSALPEPSSTPPPDSRAALPVSAVTESQAKTPTTAGPPRGADRAKAAATPQGPLHKITFNSSPLGAKVWLDGKSLGETPILDYPVPEGEHVLAIQPADGETSRRTITVGEQTAKKYTFDEATGTWRSEL